MGACQTYCQTVFYGQKDILVLNEKQKEEINIFFERKENFIKLIFLQTRIRRYLKKRGKRLKLAKVPTCKSNKHQKYLSNKDFNNDIITTKEGNMICSGLSNSARSGKNNQKTGKQIFIPSITIDIKNKAIITDDPFLTISKAINSIRNVNDPRIVKDAYKKVYPEIEDDGFIYSGEWKNGKREGLGVLSWKDISKYIGNFSENEVNGFGILYLENEDIYQGYLRKGKADGIGRYQKKESMYEGYWYNDKQNIFGIEKWPKGSHYIGEFHKGNKEGIGVLNFEGNGIYEGEFKGGSFNGFGSFFFKDGRKYQGMWKNNKKHGFGKITWPDFQTFEGEFFEDKKDGFGVFYSLKKIYIGMWKESLLEGDAIIIEKGKTKKQYWSNGRAIKNHPDNYYISFEKLANSIKKIYEGNK